MAQVMVGSTDPELLKRVAAMWDNPARHEFFALYNPFVLRCCSAYGLDSSTADELRQRVWVELAVKASRSVSQRAGSSTVKPVFSGRGHSTTSSAPATRTPGCLTSPPSARPERGSRR